MSLQDVLIDELRDLYSAENQLVKALPKTIKGIKNAEMKANVRTHLEETKNQVLRLREVFQHLGKKPTGEHCKGMEGCIEEVKEALDKDEEGALKDAGILGAALRVEHYEIAGYSAAIAMAKVLKEKEIVALLTENLNEEKNAAKNVLAGGAPILKEASLQEDEEDDGEEEGPEEEESERESEQDEEDAKPELSKRGKK
jgi:ferritin-like metal-binding protein YciE